MRHSLKWFTPLVVAFALLAGCGSAASGAGAKVAATPAPGSADLNGCQVQAAGGLLKVPDVTATQSETLPQPVSLTKGQILEIRLPATVRWSLNPADVSSVLNAESAQSLYEASDSSCMWQFTAKASGAIELDFSGGLVCSPGAACPALARLMSFAVTVN